MNHTHNIQQAIAFAIEVHETHQKQKRKGKDIPYITHPLTVGLILARVGASEDVICAGILHDVIEDSVHGHRITREMLAERFNNTIADLVTAVTESDKNLSWAERKAEALAHIASYSHDALLVKSADITSNMTELIADYERDGELTWTRFHASKDAMLEHTRKLIDAIITSWSENPLIPDLKHITERLPV